jgi:transformation/transcription domain-associated protein
LETLKRLTHLPSILPLHAYNAIKEQLLCYAKMPTYYKIAIDVINSTNMELFEPAQKAEIYQIKGDIYSKMGFFEESEKSFSISLKYHKDYDLAWLGWGKYWDTQAQLNSTLPQHLKFTTHALNCYMQGLKCSNFASRHILSRVIWMLTLRTLQSKDSIILEDNPSPSTHPRKKKKYCREFIAPKDEKPLREKERALLLMFSNHVENTPEWLWIVWLNEMLLGLSKLHSQVFKQLLCRLAVKYPQALFYELNSYIMFCQHSLQPSICLSYANDIMMVIKTKNPALANNLMRLCTEISTVFIPSPSDSLIQLLKNVLLHCYDFTNLEMQKILIIKYFHHTYRTIFVEGDNNLIQKSPLLKSISESFERDFLQFAKSENDEGVPFNMDLVIKSLKLYITRLTDNQDDRSNKKRSLESFSSFLSEFQDDQVQIPGQFTYETEPCTDDHHLIEKFLSPVRQICNTSVKTFLSIRGNQGETSHFFVENQLDERPHAFTSTHLILADDPIDEINDGLNNNNQSNHFEGASWGAKSRFAKLMRHMNVIIRDTTQAKKRQVYVPVTNYIPLTDSINLVQASEEVVPLWKIFSDWSYSKGFNPDASLEMYRNQYLASTAQYPSVLQNSSEMEQLKYSLYNHISTHLCPNHILNEFIYSKLLDDYDSAWHFRKHFTIQLALTSLIGYLFSTEKRNPFNFAFYPHNAQLHLSEFLPRYSASGLLLESSKENQFITVASDHHLNSHYEDDDGILKQKDEQLNAYFAEEAPVPFIISPNIQHFIGSIGLTGLFNSANLASVLALANPDVMDDIKNRLRIFFECELQTKSKTPPTLLHEKTPSSPLPSSPLLSPIKKEEKEKNEITEEKKEEVIPENVELVAKIEESSSSLNPAQIQHETQKEPTESMIGEMEVDPTVVEGIHPDTPNPESVTLPATPALSASNETLPPSHYNHSHQDNLPINTTPKSHFNRTLNLVEANTDLVHRKLSSLAPNQAGDAPISHVVPINHAVASLLDAAVDPLNLSRISPYYFPWF